MTRSKIDRYSSLHRLAHALGEWLDGQDAIREATHLQDELLHALHYFSHDLERKTGISIEPRRTASGHLEGRSEAEEASSRALTASGRLQN
jgi:hypothetical protein